MKAVSAAKNVLTALKSDPVLLISGLLAALSMFFVHPDAEYVSYIDYRVLALLFSLMCGFSPEKCALFAGAFSSAYVRLGAHVSLEQLYEQYS